MIMLDNFCPYRVGVDVGGTNTDAVIIDTSIADHSKSVVAAQKSPTTSPNVTHGIEAAVRSVLEQSQVDPDRILSLSIGTTHFINAIIEHDARHLDKVAIIRLSKSFTREIPPFADFPTALKSIMYGYHAFVDGGLQIDGSLEAPIQESQILQECNVIKEKKIRAVVVSGVFSPLDSHFYQEQAVRKIINRELPNVAVVCSSEVSSIGFLERENASILNASILHFARRTIHEFQQALKRLNLHCSLYLTQNDGTMIDAHKAARLPIRTFSSGPTNSMRGAAYLSGLYTDGKANATSIVCDIGGTTSDVGVLLPSGYPRQGVANASVANVNVNYSMPHVESIGIGGGSIVRRLQDSVTVGSDSVGYAIQEKALIFGGDTMTATDIAIASGVETSFGDKTLATKIDNDTVTKGRAVIKTKLEKVIDRVKTSPEPLELILVGGGSIIAPEGLDGVTRIIRPPHHDVANAVGAAIAKVSAVVDIIQNTSKQSSSEALEKAVALAKERAIAAGAKEDTIIITEKELLPLQYVESQLRTIVKAVGEFVTSRSKMNGVLDTESGFDDIVDDAVLDSKPSHEEVSDDTSFNIDTYKPLILKNPSSGIPEWYVSAIDLEWLADGCYVLGCGGGGTPYPEMLKLKMHLKDGHILRIVDPEDLNDDARIYWSGNMGSPAVPAERLSASESIESVKEMMEYFHHDSFHAVMGVEIGGSNGLQPLTIGSSKNFNRPAIDADWMGRAYPNLWQVTIAVQEKNQIIPCAIASGDGRAIIMTKTSSDKIIDSTLRAPAVEMGYYVGFCARPTSTAMVQKWSVRNTMSQAWRIGRCIARATIKNTISSVVDQIIDEVGGPACAKLLFQGKIIGIERRLFKGHSHGEVVIEHVVNDDCHDSHNVQNQAVAAGGSLRIPFMNENLLARHINAAAEEHIIATVPDLITVLDANTGKALGIGEYRYGVMVNVLGITCAPVWNDNSAGLEAGGPIAFGYDEIGYKPLGTYHEPGSVIREFGGLKLQS